MIKILFLLTFLQILLFGYEYDELTLKAQATVFPKLLLLDQDVSKKLVDDQIQFSIVYQEGERREAQKVKAFIEKQFGKTLGAYKLNVIIESYEKVQKGEKSTAYYILNSRDDQMQKVAQIGMDHNLIVYTYDKQNFQNSILISLAIKDSTIIYLNKEMLKSYKINFVDALYQIVKLENGH